MPPPPLTIPDILAWADAHHKATGRWPKMDSGPVVAGPLGTTWRQVDNALRLGLRGLEGGSSLARLLDEHRYVRNKKNLPPLTHDAILAWADLHRQRTGKWPNENSGPVEGQPGEDWQNINAALAQGHRGLPGNDTLAKLLARARRARNKAAVKPLTVAKILKWADRHRRQTGKWPTKDAGEVICGKGETWAAIAAALQQGGRGLPPGSSLARLLAQHRGRRNKSQLPRLTIEGILAMADAWHAATGKWPRADSGVIPGTNGQTWHAVNLALYQGLRSLPGGDSLRRILLRYRALERRRQTPAIRTKGMES